MPRNNILADFQSAVQSINLFSTSLHEFKKQTLKIKELYDPDCPEPYLKAIDGLLGSLSYKDMFLIIAVLGDEQTLVSLLQKSEDRPDQIIEKLFLIQKSFV